MRATKKNQRTGRHPAFTLVEALVAVGITATILAVYASVLSSAFFLRRLQNDFQVSAFIQEELDSLRSLSIADLTTRTNGNLLGLSITRGPWMVATAASPPSGTKVLTMTTAQPAIVSETGLAVLPGNYRQNANFIAKVDALGASPSGWAAGIAFRYRDAENYYRFRFNAGGIALDKVQAGTASTLWSQSAAYAKDTWYTLEVDTSYENITLKKNGTTLATLTDFTFDKGDLAVMAMSNAQVSVDDVSVTENAATTTWNFDGDAVGTMPSDWQRFSAFDLPGGGATLTVANYLGDASMKQATVTVTWKDGTATRTSSGTSVYIN